MVAQPKEELSDTVTHSMWRYERKITNRDTKWIQNEVNNNRHHLPLYSMKETELRYIDKLPNMVQEFSSVCLKTPSGKRNRPVRWARDSVAYQFIFSPAGAWILTCKQNSRLRQKDKWAEKYHFIFSKQSFYKEIEWNISEPWLNSFTSLYLHNN